MSTKKNIIRLFNPRFIIKKSRKPTAFVDTFMWGKILKNNELKNILLEVCKFKKCFFVISSFQKGEMLQRNLFREVEKICKENLLIIPVGRIKANQIIHSMIAYYEDIKEVKLDWNLMISEIPILKPPQANLKKLIQTLANELNIVRNNVKNITKEDIIPAIVQLEREIWREKLKIYWDMIPKFSKKCRIDKNYDEFFYSDYFTDLLSIILESYLLGYILKERKVKMQDIIDMANISELVPYTVLSLLDKDQYNRILVLQKDYPILFRDLFKYVYIASFHKESPDPESSLSSFLLHCIN